MVITRLRHALISRAHIGAAHPSYFDTSILQAIEVPADDENGNEGVNLLLLRNPWGHGEYT